MKQRLGKWTGRWTENGLNGSAQRATVKQHKVQLEARHEWCTPCVDLGADTLHHLHERPGWWVRAHPRQVCRWYTTGRRDCCSKRLCCCSGGPGQTGETGQWKPHEAQQRENTRSCTLRADQQDLGVLVDTKPNVLTPSQTCWHQANGTMGCIRQSVGSPSMEVILPLCSALGEPYLEHWAPQ